MASGKWQLLGFLKAVAEMATKSATVSAASLTSAPLKETINQELYAVIGDSQPSLSLVSPLQLTDKRPTKKW